MCSGYNGTGKLLPDIYPIPDEWAVRVADIRPFWQLSHVPLDKIEIVSDDGLCSGPNPGCGIVRVIPTERLHYFCFFNNTEYVRIYILMDQGNRPDSSGRLPNAMSHVKIYGFFTVPNEKKIGTHMGFPIARDFVKPQY